MNSSLPGSSVHETSYTSIPSGFPFPSPGDLPDPGVKPRSPTLQADSLPYEPPENPDPDVHGYKNPQKNISKPN